MKRKTLIICLLLIANGIVMAQTYNNPESMAYDAIGKRYFISNKGGNTIVQLDADNNLTNFVTSGLQEPKGLLLIGDTLIAINNNSIQGFLISDASIVINTTVDGSIFMNDVTSDGKGNLYVSDMNRNAIYKFVLKTQEYTIFNSEATSPNGLLYVASRNAVLVANLTGNAKIQSLSLSDSSLTDIVSTKLSNLDGLAEDNCGNIYVTSWGSGAVFVFDSLFQKPPTKLTSGYSGPADICITENEQILAIPIYESNTIKLIDLNLACRENITYLTPANKSANLEASVQFDWEDIDGVDGYVLEYSTDSMFYGSVKSLKTMGSDTIVAELKPNTKYFWRIRIQGGESKNIFSDAWQFTTMETYVGIAGSVKADEISVYPNPFNTKLSFSENITSATIFNLSGQKIMSKIGIANSIENIELPKGIYLLEYETLNGSLNRQVIIKQ